MDTTSTAIVFQDNGELSEYNTQRARHGKTLKDAVEFYLASSVSAGPGSFTLTRVVCPHHLAAGLSIARMPSWLAPEGPSTLFSPTHTSVPGLPMLKAALSPWRA